MNPYPGLRPFTVSESKWFFGREALDGILETQVHISPLTLMFARSGVGKSSYLSCRFIPAMEGEAETEYMNEWGTAPPEDLIRAKFDTLMERRSESKEKPILILDQFEDVFKLEASREKLWDTIAEFVNIDDSPINLLVSMREEWLGAWGETSDYLLGARVATLRLAPLRDIEMRRAITKPAEKEGSINFSQDLADRIVQDLKTPNAYGLGDRYVEPGLVQLVCRRLWEEASARQLVTADNALYDDIGGANEIVKEFVSAQLRKAGTGGALFTPLDRVVWAGVTRQLSAAQGVKALVTPAMVCKKVVFSDLGIAGPSVIASRLSRKQRKYLDSIPENRGEPPAVLLEWISEILNAGEVAGLLKKQSGLRAGENIFELSHDSLSPLLQQFAGDLEAWIRAKWYKLVGALFGICFVLPMFVAFVVWKGLSFAEAALGLVVVVVVLIFYGILVWLSSKIFALIFEVLSFPILRRLCRGIVPFAKPATGVKRARR
jgi:hypothetical protein